MSNKGFNLKATILIIVITSILSSVTTGIIINKNYESISGVSYFDILTDENLSEFLSVYSEIKENFYGEYDEIGMIDAAKDALVTFDSSGEDDLIDYAIDAMLSYLGDDYTVFLSDDASEYLSSELSGTYEGIGVTVSGRYIISVTKNSPAEEAGLEVGDCIESVNGQNVTDDYSYLVSYFISNSEDENIELVILRNGEYITYNLVKTTLDSSTRSTMITDTTVGYISLSVFSENCSDSFKDALLELEEDGMEKLIIDLRDNGGGYLSQAIEIASFFLENGDTINSLVSNDGKTINYDETDESRDYEIIILMNEDSASASEILASALQDNDKAEIVGTQSFGKGTVQQLLESSTGSSAKYTTAYWYTPNNICINNVGITPDYYVELEYEVNDDGEEIGVIDTQFNKAIEILTEA